MAIEIKFFEKEEMTIGVHYDIGMYIDIDEEGFEYEYEGSRMRLGFLFGSVTIYSK